MTVLPMVASAGEPANTDTMSMPAGHMDHKKMDGMSMTGDADYDFAANMYTHHQKALDMSQAELKNGKDPQMLRMAKDIVAAQKKEMATMKQWMDAHKKP